jgi:hypothetical protein
VHDPPDVASVRVNVVPATDRDNKEQPSVANSEPRVTVGEAGMVKPLGKLIEIVEPALKVPVGVKSTVQVALARATTLDPENESPDTEVPAAMVTAPAGFTAEASSEVLTEKPAAA